MENNVDKIEHEKLIDSIKNDGLSSMKLNFQRICYKKCVVKQTDTTLTVGEATCLDRCVLKFFEAQAVVSRKIMDDAKFKSQTGK